MPEIRIRFFSDLANASEDSEPDRMLVLRDVTPEQWNAAGNSKVISWTHTRLPDFENPFVVPPVITRFAEYYDTDDDTWIEFAEIIPTPATVLGFPKVT